MRACHRAQCRRCQGRCCGRGNLVPGHQSRPRSDSYPHFLPLGHTARQEPLVPPPSRSRRVPVAFPSHSRRISVPFPSRSRPISVAIRRVLRIRNHCNRENTLGCFAGPPHCPSWHPPLTHSLLAAPSLYILPNGSRPISNPTGIILHVRRPFSRPGSPLINRDGPAYRGVGIGFPVRSAFIPMHRTELTRLSASQLLL